MRKMKSNIINNSINSKKKSFKKVMTINPNYFSIKYIPYNQLLNSLMIFLQKKLSPIVFNEVYLYFINEIKKYINTSSQNNLFEKDKETNTNISFKINNKRSPLISESSFNKYIEENKKASSNIKKNLSKKIKPLVGLSYFNKLNKKKNLTDSNFSSLKIKNIDINFIKGLSSYNNYKNNKPVNTTINKSIKNLNEKDSSYIPSTANLKNKKKILLNNKFIMNERLMNKNYKTINTSIQKDKYKYKKTKKTNKENNSQLISKNSNNKINNKKILSKVAFQSFIDLTNKNDENKYKIINNSNIKNAVFINNTIFNKYKNNYNIDLLESNNKQDKKINIKLERAKNNGGRGVLKPVQASEEMLKKIKNSLDDDNLKEMLNFSYENFLSKESEGESKEYSIED